MSGLPPASSSAAHAPAPRAHTGSSAEAAAPSHVAPTIRPARPVSGAGQSQLELGAPLRPSGPRTAIPLDTTPSSAPATTARAPVTPAPVTPAPVTPAPVTPAPVKGADAGAAHSLPPRTEPAPGPTLDAEAGALTRVSPRQRLTSQGAPPPLGPSTSSHMVVSHRSSPMPLMPESPSAGSVVARSPPAVSMPRATSQATMPAPAAPQAPHAEDTKVRGLRRLLAMVTCGTSSATVAAALDNGFSASPSASLSAPPSSSDASARRVAAAPSMRTSDHGAADENAPPAVEPSGSAGAPAATTLPTSTTLHDTTRASVSQPVTGGAQRSSLGSSENTSYTDELDDFSQDVITQVPQHGGAPPMMLDADMEQELYAEEQRLIQQGGWGIPVDEYGHPAPLLNPAEGVLASRKCLVLDLDETLVHSSFKMVPNADFIVPVEIEGIVHNVYVIKRPGVDEFMRLMGQWFEVVIFTASLNKYADPVIDILDIHKVVSHRLFRESCYNHHGSYVKDLSQLGRPLQDTIILDNSPASYIFHPTNAVPVSSWFNDPHDTELTDLCPFLADLCAVNDVRIVLDGFIGSM